MRQRIAWWVVGTLLLSGAALRAAGPPMSNYLPQASTSGSSGPAATLAPPQVADPPGTAAPIKPPPQVQAPVSSPGTDAKAPFFPDSCDAIEPDSCSPADFTPNMFGGFLVSPLQQVVFPQPPLVILVPPNVIPGTQPTSVFQTYVLSPSYTAFFPGAGTSPIHVAFNPLGPVTLGGVSVSGVPTFTTVATFPPSGSGTLSYSVPATLTLSANASTTQNLVNAAAQAMPGAGTPTLTAVNVAPVIPGRFPNTVSPAGAIGTGPVAVTFDYVNPATPSTSTSQPSLLVPQPTLVYQLPNPAGGGAVGLTRVSDDNNPLPRDRVIFDYDYLNGVPLTAGGVAVNRFSLGLEKTFFDRRASLEVRVPFASTVSSDILADGLTNTSRAELGDVHLAFKGLLYRSAVLNFAAGLAMDLPTANGTRILLSDGTTLVHLANDAVLLTPYFSYLLTPNDRLFFQNWFQFVCDPNGDRVDIDPNHAGLQSIGRIEQQGILEVDAQVGYWVYRSDNNASLVQALAPFLELHYSSTMGRSDLVQANGFAVGLDNSHFDQLTLAAGWVTQVADNFLLSVGGVAPLKGNEDRSFDYQIGIRGSYFFGPTARSRASAPAVSSF